MVRLSDTAKYAVFEGDEYLTSPLDLRSKFLWYHPHVAILTGIAWDHINVFPTFPQYVETFRKFVDTIEPNGAFIYFDADENLQAIASQARKDISCVPYNAYTGMWRCKCLVDIICKTCKRPAWLVSGLVSRQWIFIV